jgi:hypothetical protein
VLCRSLTKGVDYMTDPTTFLQVQNGISTGLKLQPDPTPLCLHDGRGWPRIPTMMLYQAYFIAYLVLHAVNGGDPWPFNPKSAPLNPGNPYNASKTQNGLGTMGQPDIAATLASVASEALKAVWYQSGLCIIDRNRAARLCI